MKNLRDQGYTPNHIPREQRVWHVLLSIFLLVYGGYGLAIDDFVIPTGKHSYPAHLHGVFAWIGYFAILLAALNLLSVVADHYDRRNNERNYFLFAKVTQISGWISFIIALLGNVGH